jgi:hypothetical protein
MSTKETYLRDLVIQMLKVNFEITVLAFRVEEAMPDVRRDCYRHVRSLQHGYKDVESKVEAFIVEGQDDNEGEGYDEIDRAVKELLRLLEREGTAIRGRLQDKVYFGEESPGTLPVAAKIRMNKESRLQVAVRRSKRQRPMPLENWVEGELWSRKKIT